MRSRIFEKYGITNIGQQLFKRSFSQFLKIGDAFAIFSLSGKIPVLNDRLKIHIKGASFLDEGDVYIITSSFIRFQQKNVFLNSSSVIVF